MSHFCIKQNGFKGLGEGNISLPGQGLAGSGITSYCCCKVLVGSEAPARLRSRHLASLLS